MTLIPKTLTGFMKNINQGKEISFSGWIVQYGHAIMHSKRPSRQNQHTTDMFTSVRNKVTTQTRRAKSNVFVNVLSNARCIWPNIKNLTGNNATNKNVRELQINGNLTHVSNEITTALITPVHKSNLQCLCGLRNSKAKDAFHMDTTDSACHC